MRAFRYLVYTQGGGWTTVEITARTLQGRYLLKPDETVNRIIAGVLARASERFGVEVNADAFLSGHFHLMIAVQTRRAMSRFMQYVMSNIARKIGRYRGWHGKFWQRRYTSIEISPDEASIIDRYDYILRHGAKEHLVASPLDWPGLHFAKRLAQDLWHHNGHWDDQTKAYRLKNAGKRVRTIEIRTQHQLQLHPPRCWRHKERAVICEWVRERVAQVEDEFRDQPVLGVKAILAQPIEERPKNMKGTYAPRFHAKDPETRKEMREAYRIFVRHFFAASARLERFLKPEDDPYYFPSGCQPPLAPSVPETA